MFRDHYLVGVLLIGKIKLLKVVRKALQTPPDMQDFLATNPNAEQVAAHLQSLFAEPSR
jgi:hypothetical protein